MDRREFIALLAVAPALNAFPAMAAGPVSAIVFGPAGDLRRTLRTDEPWNLHCHLGNGERILVVSDLPDDAACQALIDAHLTGAP